MAPDQADDGSSPAWLRAGDHASLAVLTASGLLLILAYWLYHSSRAGGMVKVDRAVPLTAAFQVDLNSAEPAELLQLPGVGPSLAQRVVDDRRLRGNFRTIDELTRVDGIGPRTLERIKPYLLPIETPREDASRELAAAAD